MSTFHKSGLASYKIKNQAVAQQASKETLLKMQDILNQMSSTAISFEQLVLRELPKFTININFNEPVYFTTIIVALKGVIERELQLREIYEHDLFSDENF